MDFAIKKIREWATLFLSISGFVPSHATILRTIVMSVTFFYSIHLINSPITHEQSALIFFVGSTFAYIGFLYLVLPEKGLRLLMIDRFGEENAFLIYEGILAFLFFINGTSIGYVSAAYRNTLPFTINFEIVATIAFLFFLAGWIIKLWAAKVVGIEIYYWKDMFFGRKISQFVVEGPYKFINNPMYGLGQLQAYATALWYLSLPGLIAAFINQLAVFSFYHFQEKKFIKRIYLQ